MIFLHFAVGHAQYGVYESPSLFRMTVIKHDGFRISPGGLVELRDGKVAKVPSSGNAPVPVVMAKDGKRSCTGITDIRGHGEITFPTRINDS